jgi:fructosamine-3-kinase
MHDELRAEIAFCMDAQLLSIVRDILAEEIVGTKPLSGGDISSAYFIETKNQRLFLKLNDSPDAMDMLEREREGLEAISKTKTIATPGIVHCGRFERGALLLMEYVEARQANSRDLDRLGREVAHLHHVTSAHFGWERDNFIGRLPQENDLQETWSDFYITRRLLPQLKMSRDSAFLTSQEIPGEQKMLNLLESLSAGVKPSLLHGDLWSGNYLIAVDGTPYLIDPAAYYGHNEVDLAMSRLFGGFGDAFYRAYHDVIPQQTGAEERNDLYQLYYLLVHLNMFGRSYKQAVIGIVRRYFL